MTPFAASLCGRLAAGAIVAVCAVAAVAPSGASASVHRVRIGTPPIVPAGVTPVAGSAAVGPMRVTVALKPRRALALARYARAVSNPSSTNYRRYLTVAEFRRRFAPGPAVVRRVRAGLRAQGLPGGALTANGLALKLRTDSARVEHGFALTLARVRAGRGTDVVYNVQAPAVRASIAGAVQAVIGLDGFSHERGLVERPAPARDRRPASVAQRAADTATARVASGGPSACAAARDAQLATISRGYLSYTADQVASAYSFSGLYAGRDLGAGVTVALYELEPNLAGDIAAYQRCYGTDASVGYVKVDGGAPPDPTAGGPAGAGEAALDIEQVIGLAPKARILVYQGPNSLFAVPGSGPYDVYAKIIGEDRAAVISTSWGACEAEVGAAAAAAESTLFEEAVVQGQTVVAAAGDAGSEDCYFPSAGSFDSDLAVDDPASQPFVTAVGGTSMTAIGPAPTESVWNDGAAGGGGGGGLSQIWNMPGYQSTAAAALGVIRSGSSTLEGCGPTSAVPRHPYCRQVPDVSADADENTGYLTYYDGSGIDPGVRGWQPVGGTSAAAPLWAALFALSDSGCSVGRVGFANGRLYTLAGQSQSTYFNDVTGGNNDVLGVHADEFTAAPGYDLASGLGTPIASQLAPALCRTAISIRNPGPRRTLVGARVRLQLHASRGAGVSGTLRYGERNLPAGLTLNPATGVISGRARTVGVRHVRVDAYVAGQIYGAVGLTWTVAARPRASAAVLAGVAAGAPNLRLRVTAGAHEAALRTFTLTLPAGLRTPTAARRLLRVLTGGGRPVARRVSDRGRVVSLRLLRARRVVRLLFERGSLRVAAPVRERARVADRRLALKLVVVDADGYRTLLKLSVRPRA